MSNEVITEIADGIMTVRFNRPEKKNALTQTMYGTVAEALQSADERDDVRVILLTGGGDCFTAGNDLNDFLNNPPRGEDTPVSRFLKGLTRTRTPIVAAVNGVAVGVGTTMLLHCDLVYAGEGATLHMPFVNLGLVPEAGSSLLLPALIGQQRAAELLMLGEPFDAATAERYGIVNRVCADAETESVAQGVAARLAAKPPEALRQTKDLLRHGQGERLRERMQLESGHFTERLKSPEAREAMQAIMERRQPDFSQFS
ncbi:enoyl-CoA hydratase [Ectothiorhodospiraceae bacterium WFHF3C12]|nr:enoyl-CoA hydratase [Ectothiorhodospiraceae bacterium WFHF3C12]